MTNMPIDNALSKNIWNELGGWWDAHMLEGDIFHHYLIHPYIFSQLELNKQDNVIDLACGNGALTRRLSDKLSKPIVGVDFSASLLECAKKRDAELGFNNHYHQIDLMDEVALMEIKNLSTFNKAVCSMAIQDIEKIEPLLKTVKLLLPPGGYFIVSIPHPCFNSGSFTFRLEERSILRSKYINQERFLVQAKDNQPVPHPHFHRPLSNLINTFSHEGFVLDYCDEPVFQAKDFQAIGNKELWLNFPEIPPALILRFIA